MVNANALALERRGRASRSGHPEGAEASKWSAPQVLARSEAEGAWSGCPLGSDRHKLETRKADGGRRKTEGGRWRTEDGWPAVGASLLAIPPKPIACKQAPTGDSNDVMS